MSITVKQIIKNNVTADSLTEIDSYISTISKSDKISISKLSNGKYFAQVEDKSGVVPSTELVLKDETFTENGEYTVSEGYDGYGTVTVDVPETIKEVEKIVEVPAQPILKNETFTENGEYTVSEGFDGFGNISINVTSIDEEGYSDFLKWKQYHFTSYMGPETPENEEEIYDGMKLKIQVLSDKVTLKMKVYSGSIQWGDGSYIEHIEDFATENVRTISSSFDPKCLTISHSYGPGIYDLYFSSDFEKVEKLYYDQLKWNNILILELGGKIIKNLDFSTALFNDTIVLPYGVETIEDCVFEENNEIISLTVPTTLRTVGHRAFCRCYNLSKLDIPINSSLTEVGTASFFGCPIENLLVPSSLTTINEQAFCGAKCIKLTQSNPKDININVFSSDNLQAIYVPYSQDHSVINTYKNANGWSNYANIIFESDPE